MWDLLFTGNAMWFSVPALFGTGLFALRLVLMLAGGHHGLDGHDAGDAHDGDPQLLSIQGVLAFLMGFGWTGLVVLSSTPAQLIVALAAALVVGTISMYVMARLMTALMKLQTSGNVDTRSAVGAPATVYVTIPGQGKGMGQVTIILDQKQRTFDAVSTGDELARNARVRVIEVRGQSTLVVAPE